MSLKVVLFKNIYALFSEHNFKTNFVNEMLGSKFSSLHMDFSSVYSWTFPICVPSRCTCYTQYTYG